MWEAQLPTGTLSEFIDLSLGWPGKNIVLSLCIGWWVEDTILLPLPSKGSYLFNLLRSEFHLQISPFKLDKF